MPGDGYDPGGYPDGAFAARIYRYKDHDCAVSGVDNGLDERGRKRKAVGVWDRAAPACSDGMSSGIVSPGGGDRLSTLPELSYDVDQRIWQHGL